MKKVDTSWVDKKSVKLYLENYEYSPTQMLYDIINGIYSEIPICCVVNYIQLQLDGKFPAKHTWKKYKFLHNHEIEYVPCPSCIKKKRFQKKVRKGMISVTKVRTVMKLLRQLEQNYKGSKT